MTDKKLGVVWDLTSYFPTFNGPEMVEFKKKLMDDIKEMQAKGSKLTTPKSSNMKKWEEIILIMEDFSSRFGHLDSYMECLSSADASNEEYKKEDAWLARLRSEYEKFEVDILRGFKAASDEDFQTLIDRDALKAIAHQLRRTRERAVHTMSREEEILAAELNVDGFHGWGRLYDTITGKLEFDMIMPDGKTVRKPISEWRSLMEDTNREIGRAAYEGGNKAWRGIEDICAAALNAISGTRLTLFKHRGYDSFLDFSLWQASIKQKSLDAMYKAIHENIDIAREIFRVKAKLMGRSGIWWFEREAPLPLKTSSQFSWVDGSAIVGKAFGTVFPSLADYYNSFLAKRWIESEKRGGKRPGAFCTSSSFINQQRVYMTFNGSLGDVTTLAHEVGHAFHGHLLREMRPMARRYPMTLAETASIFAELILADGIYEDKNISDEEKLLMLDADICNAAVLLLDITARFEFEKAFYEERKNGEVSVSRLKELMVNTQRDVFGDSMIPESADPYFWASKLHFYITTVSFYNFPYTFGFLLARALYAIFKKEGASFLPKYEAFLRLTGSDTVEKVAKKSIKADITKPDFWAVSITSLNDQLKQYKELLSRKK